MIKTEVAMGNGEKDEVKKISKLVKYGQTINLNLGCLGMGLMTSVIGATLLDLAEVYDTRIDMASHIITFRGVGALLGSLIGGMLLDKFNTQILIGVATLVAAVGISLVPICSRLDLAFGATLMYGFTAGVFDTGANIWIINLWGKKNGPMLQLYHFAFGLGGLLSPIVAEPFLSLHQTGPSIDSSAMTSSLDDDLLSMNTTLLHRPSRIEIPYGIIGSIHLMLFTSMAIFYWIDPSDTKPSTSGTVEEVRIPPVKKYTLLMSLSFYLMVYVALESCLGQMLSVFAVRSKLRFTKSEASYLCSLFWTTFTLSRVFSAFWATRSTPRNMMFTEHAMSVMAFGLFLWFGETNRLMVWVCAALVGIGAAGMFATAVTWTVEYMPLSNKMMSVSTIFSGSGGMAPPFIVGNFIDDKPMVLMEACTAIIVILTLIMLFMWGLTSNMTPRKSMIMDDSSPKGENCEMNLREIDSSLRI